MSTTATSSRPFDFRWMASWQDLVNSEPAVPVIGKRFDTDFLLGFDDSEYLVAVRGGRITHITDEVTADTPWQFALRGPRESWERFTQATPPPMYNDIWAMAHPLHGRLRMEGNLVPFWQHLRSLNHMLDQMRRVPS